MSIQINIPPEELQQFKSFLQIYKKGEVILHEGDSSDQRFFLLRQGELEVQKNLGDQPQVLGKITAVNIFGEMSLVSGRPRSATIVAASDPVLVYAFDNPNLAVILANPKWSLMLVTRLVDNMAERYTNLEVAERQNKKYRSALQDMVGTLTILFATSGRDEFSKQMFLDSLPKIIGYHLAEMDIKPRLPDAEQLKNYNKLGLLSDYLQQLTEASRKKMK